MYNNDIERLIPKQLITNKKEEDSIFISFPSLNDPECNNTVISAFEMSSNPDRIYIGIYQQNDINSGLDCLDISSVNCPFSPICTRLSHVSIIRATIADAKGPTWGRYMSDSLYNNQKFLFITDSHSLFRPMWDDLLLNLWYNLKNEYGIITHYPKPITSMKNDMERWTSGNSNLYPYSYHICGSIFEIPPNNMPRNANGCYVNIKRNLLENSKSILVPFWAAGFSFSKSHLRDNVKFDPNTQYMFHGEEFHFSTRAWTHGYDFYSPPYDIIFHRYFDIKTTKRKNINDINSNSNIRDNSEKRTNFMWGILLLRTPNININNLNLIDIDKEYYYLGKKRSLNDYWKLCGIDIVNKNITVFKEEIYSNGGLTRIPWLSIKDNIDE